MKQYRKKIALPAGVDPNIISETLNSGCAISIAQIHAYDQSIDHGRCGMASKINDVKGFSDVLLSLCTDKNLNLFFEYAYRYG